MSTDAYDGVETDEVEVEAKPVFEPSADAHDKSELREEALDVEADMST